MLCLDTVVGLYPSITHKEGLTVLRNILDGRQDKTVSTDSLKDLASIVLKNSYFEFEFYKNKEQPLELKSRDHTPFCLWTH